MSWHLTGLSIRVKSARLRGPNYSETQSAQIVSFGAYVQVTEHDCLSKWYSSSDIAMANASKGLSSVESVTYGQQLLAKKFKTKIAGV